MHACLPSVQALREFVADATSLSKELSALYKEVVSESLSLRDRKWGLVKS